MGLSSYKIIYEVSKLLHDTLWSGFFGDASVTQFVSSKDAIVLDSPAEAVQGERSLSLWLYQVTPDAFVLNQLPMRPQPRNGMPSDDDSIQYPPLALDLFYLLTPSTTKPDGDQIVLGRAMQILHDNAILLLQSTEAPGKAEELHIGICQRSLTEVAEVWEAMQQPYRLSLCYEVRVIRIDSLRLERTGRVSERSSRFQNSPAAVTA